MKSWHGRPTRLKVPWPLLRTSFSHLDLLLARPRLGTRSVGQRARAERYQVRVASVNIHHHRRTGARSLSVITPDNMARLLSIHPRAVHMCIRVPCSTRQNASGPRDLSTVT